MGIQKFGPTDIDPRQWVDGAALTWVTVATVKAGATGITSRVRDYWGVASIDWTGELTAASLAASGVSGLDTGSEAADTWYALHVIADSSGTNPVELMFSLSETAPTMPSGYDLFRRIGWCRNDATSNLFKFVQSGRGRNRMFWLDVARVTSRVLNGGTATTFTSVDCSAFVPPSCTDVILLGSFAIGAGGAAADTFEVRLPGSSVTNPLWSFRAPVASNQAYRFQFRVMLSTAQAFEYTVSDGVNNSVDVFVAGYLDEL